MNDQYEDHGSYYVISIEDLAEMIGSTTRSVRTWKKKENWPVVEKPGRKIYYRVSKEFIETKKAEMEASVKDQGSDQGTASQIPLGFNREFIEAIVKPYEDSVNDLRKQVEFLQKQIEQSNEDKTILNRELENRNYQIQKFREQEKPKPEQKPFWRFW